MIASNTRFRAPWSVGLIVVSVFVTALFAGVVGAALLYPVPAAWLRWTLLILPLGLLALCALSAVRGYALENGVLWIHRPLWTIGLPLAGLRACAWDPKATRNSLRLLGNGGVFAFTGLFWNRRLGRYRMYATDLRRAVVLRFTDRTVVISPDRPEEFVRAVEAYRETR